MFDGMCDIAEQMMLRWERFGDADFDVADHMTRLTLDTIALCAFNYRFNSFYQNEMHPFVSAMVDALAEAGARSRRPAIASKMMLGTRLRYDADIALLQQVAETLIDERRRDPNGASHGDLLNTMLNGRDPVTGERLSDENIRYQMVTFLIAGHETTSGLLSFAVYFLLQNPEVLQRARAVVDEVLGAATPRYEDLPKLRYIEQILMEALRLWPTAPAFAVKPNEPTLLGGRYPVTPESTLLVLIPMLHRDPTVWGDDAEAFRPERFAPEEAEKRPANAWKPFGNGVRACIGRGFAIQEAQLVLSLMLQRFTLTAVDPHYKLEVAETLTLKPHGLRIRVRRRDDVAGRPRSAVPTLGARTLKPSAPVAAGETPTTPLLVLYGTNTGSSEAFAQRIASEAGAHGCKAVSAPLDDYVDRLPSEGAVIVVTASYEGQPPDNARQFVPWIESRPAGALKGISFAVFGCGNRQWARTYQAIPKRIDAAFETAGAARLTSRGEADASGDFFGTFDEWYSGLWAAFDGRCGKTGVPEAGQPFLSVEVLATGRQAALRLADLEAAEVLENNELVDMSSPIARSKRHIEIRLPEGMTYAAGDYIAVLPRNPPQDVDRALRRFGLSAETEIIIRPGTPASTTLPTDRPISIGEVLTNYVELNQPATRAQITMLAEVTRCPPDKAALAAFSLESAYATEVLGKRLSLLDLLERFPACELSLASFLSPLPPLRARQYSISSSPLRDPGQCSLTVAVLDAPAFAGHRRHKGVASTYLADLKPGARLPVAVRPSQARFHPPSDPKTPMIMVCAGSGIAPFHGFLQERSLQKEAGQEVGPSLLFFGIDHSQVDFLYRDELSQWQKAGVVDVRPAFSEAPDGDVRFVQHRIWRDRADVAKLFREGAQVFVCGDGRHMAPAVRSTFIEIYKEAMGVGQEEADAWADKVEREAGRYVADVFA
jgi:cytochrome P450 / NADPH-cytochrome P450 reductase